MVWLDEVDLQAARSLRWTLDQGQVPLDLRRTALAELAALVPSDVSSCNRIALATGVVEHEVVPGEAEPSGAFEELSPTAAGHPLLYPHAVCPRPPVRLSEAVDSRRLERSELYRELLHRSGAEWGISIGVRPGPDEAVVFALGRHERQFSERDRVLNLSRGGAGRAAGGGGARASGAGARDRAADW